MSLGNLMVKMAECLQVTRKAAKFIKTNIGQVQSSQIIEKERNSLVSFVDEGAEKILVAGLAEIIPDAGFLTEEGTVAKEEKSAMWIIDPLDGTTNFLLGIPHFAVSVALKVDNELILGVVIEVNSGDEFTCYKGGGAFLNGFPIRVTSETNIANVAVATGFPYADRSDVENYFPTLSYFLKNTRDVRRFGSAALDLAYVACGRYGAYYENRLSVWDVAAGILLVREAGGEVRSYSNFDDPMGGSVVAASPDLMPQVMKGISLIKDSVILT
ncbi:MAG TPA: inositol monophosphatase family protein [Saprospiraceae bacterium]|nr:inositol monophosphatase family protein [Saprospiraceae bacterium]HPN67923.1 inositol monophosphatase family protein [Saprospiraceae bacterium]